MTLEAGKKFFYVPLNKPCIITGLTTQAGGVSGENNMFVTVEFMDGSGGVGDCRTFSIGLAGRYLRELRQPSKIEDTEIEETNDDDGETV